MIDQLIEQVCGKLGISNDVATKAVGVLMGLLQNKGDAGTVNEIFSKIPGASDLANQFGAMAGDEAKLGGGGLLGGLMGKLGGAGDAIEAINAFQKTGLSIDQAKDLLPVAKDFLAENVGEDAINRAFESIPALKSLLR